MPVELPGVGHDGQALIRVLGRGRHRPLQELDRPLQVGGNRAELVAGSVGDAEIGEDHHPLVGVGAGSVERLLVTVDRVVEICGQAVAGEAPTVGAAEFGESEGAFGIRSCCGGELEVGEGVVDVAGIAFKVVTGQVASGDLGHLFAGQRQP